MPSILRIAALACALALGAQASARATPIVPTRDDEVIEVLPAGSADRSEDRRARRALAERPDDPTRALDVARRDLERARSLGDPRFAGRGLAAIARWSDARTAPPDVLWMRATIQQYLHDFEGAAATLEALLTRAEARAHAQAWLTLATVRRVQGRYADADTACREVGRAGADLYARACLAENAGLRGDADAARRAFGELASQPGLPAPTLAWLLTSVAELEERDGRPAAADAAWRAVVALDADAYAVVSYADFLIAQRRPADALKLLAGQPRTDAVLLRLAIAGRDARSAGAARDAAELRERIDLANERPDARIFHGREQAMFALQVEGDAARALVLARGNVAHQREPLDLLVYARAAKASGDAAARADARRLRDALGLRDRRLDAEL